MRQGAASIPWQASCLLKSMDLASADKAEGEERSHFTDAAGGEHYSTADGEAGEGSGWAGGAHEPGHPDERGDGGWYALLLMAAASCKCDGYLG